MIMRITRASVLDVQNEDYVRTARAKGLPPHTSTGGTCCATRCCRVSTIIGLQTGLLLSGAVLDRNGLLVPGDGLVVT